MKCSAAPMGEFKSLRKRETEPLLSTVVLSHFYVELCDWDQTQMK